MDYRPIYNQELMVSQEYLDKMKELENKCEEAREERIERKINPIINRLRELGV